MEPVNHGAEPGTPRPPVEGPPVMAVSGLSKAFPGTQALDDVQLEVRRGEVHSVIGGNGSGKSTMIKILAGVLAADSGVLDIGGTTYDLSAFSPTEARRSGLHVVHQHRTTFATMTVTENLAIGRGFDTSAVGQINWRAARRRSAQLIERFGIRARPGDLVGDLGPASQTMLEIARALQDQEGAHDGVILLDEPTAALPAHEVDLLIDAVRGYAQSGQGIVFISHRLDEVLALSDRVTALRDGRIVTTMQGEGLTRQSLVTAMLGQPVEPRQREASAIQDAGTVVEVRSLNGGSVRGVDLTVKQGEVVGIAGLAGSGRSTLMRLLFGAQRITSGEISISGSPYAPRNPLDAVRAGVALVPEDRQEDAAFADLSVAENYTITKVPQFTRWTKVDKRHERRAARDAVDKFRIKTASTSVPIASLSGGNQQKVCLARWLIERPALLLLDEPTQGVDVGARAEIWEIILQAAAEGTAVLVVSSDLEELTHLCSRILIMRDGVIAGELIGPGLTTSEVNGAMHALEVAV